MARWIEPTQEQMDGWDEWATSRPEPVRGLAQRFPPWELYRLKPTGQRVTVASYFEDGTLSVNVLAQFNLTLHESSVFGIDPDDLESCELPSDDEPVGAILTREQVEDNIDALRVMIRPDLFVLDEDGKAQRKS